MARKKNFDREEKLIQAMELFWQKGYANTSIADIVEHLGINRFSLYATYTDKETLYQEALQYYLQHIGSVNQPLLTNSTASIDSIITFFEVFTKIQRQQKSGCFLQNSILERVNEDDSILQYSDAYYEHLTQLFYSALNNSVEKGQLVPEINAQMLSHFLIVQMQGIRVMGKARQYDTIDKALSILIDILNSYKK